MYVKSCRSTVRTIWMYATGLQVQVEPQPAGLKSKLTSISMPFESAVSTFVPLKVKLPHRGTGVQLLSPSSKAITRTMDEQRARFGTSASFAVLTPASQHEPVDRTGTP